MECEAEPGRALDVFLNDLDLVLQVVCQGQVIGAVVADTAMAARRGAQLVRVDYEDLPAILTIEVGLSTATCTLTSSNDVIQVARSGRANTTC